MATWHALIPTSRDSLLSVANVDRHQEEKNRGRAAVVLVGR